MKIIHFTAAKILDISFAFRSCVDKTMNARRKNRGARLTLLMIILVGAILGTILFLTTANSPDSFRAYKISEPITHFPVYLGQYPFILGSGNVIQNNTAYSYVWINSTAIKYSDSFTIFPSLNVGLKGPGINENNFTTIVTYFGSKIPNSLWLNFTITVPILGFTMNFSQSGLGGSSFPLFRDPLPEFPGIQMFGQISNLVNENHQFECFVYVANSSTPAPALLHGTSALNPISF